MNNPTTPHRLTWVWLLLAVGFAVEAGRYIYLRFYQEGPGELLRDKILGMAYWGIPLAMLCLSIFFLQRRTRLGGLLSWVMVSVSVSLGLCFLAVSIFDILESWPEPEKSLQPGSLILITIGFIGYPLVVLLVAYGYWSRGATMAGTRATILPFFLCIGLHIIQFPLSWFWPFSPAVQYGTASLALFFAATNFSLLTSSTDLRP